MRSWGRGICTGLGLPEDLEAPVMCLEESHSKQTPKLNKREWSLHQTQPKSTSWFFVTHLYNSHTNKPSSCPLHDITLSPDHKAPPSRSASGANTWRKVRDLLSPFFCLYSPSTKPLILSFRKQSELPWHSTASVHPSSLSHHHHDPGRDLCTVGCGASTWFLPLELFTTFIFTSASLHKAQCRELDFHF